MFRSKFKSEEQTTFAIFRNRKSLDLGAIVITRRGRISVRLLDIGSGGAMLSGGRELLIGERLVLMRGQYRLAANVAWKGKGRAGLEWVERLTGDKFDRFIQRLEGDQTIEARSLAQRFRGRLNRLKRKEAANDVQPIRRMPF